MEIILATQNRDKMREIQEILSSVDFTLRTLDEFEAIPEIVEDGNSLEENALKKARTIRSITGLSALADDTGLEVDALGGAPGIFSSRYAGRNATYEDNCKKLLGEMSGVPPGERTARFRCVMALALDEEMAGVARLLEGSFPRISSGTASQKERPVDALITEGVVEGEIISSPRGASGFGYDPVFELIHSGTTFAEMGSAEKNRSSHRYRALVEMRELLKRMNSKIDRSRA